LSTDTEEASVAVAGREDGARRYEVNLVYHGPADGAVTAVAAVCADPDCLGLFADPQQIAGLIDDLRAEGVNITFLGAIEVASAAYLFKSMVRRRKIRTSGHEALRESMKYALRRQLAQAFAWERRKVAVSAAPLNAASFALYGAKRYEDTADPGVWIIDAGPPAARLPAQQAGAVYGPGAMSAPQIPAAAPGAGDNGAGERYGGPPLGWSPFEDG